MKRLVEFARQAVKQRPWLYALLRPVAIGAVRVWRVGEHVVEILLTPVRFAPLWLSARSPGIGAHATGRQVVMLVVSNLRSDPRVRRAAEALAARGHDVHILCPALSGDDGAPLGWHPKISVEWLAPGAARFAYRLPNISGGAMLRAALHFRPLAFHAHDLTTAPIALSAAHANGAFCICDFHEWMSESVRADGKGGYRPLSPYVAAIRRWLEIWVIKHASATITVSRSIAEALEAAANKDASPENLRKISVIRNIPSAHVQPSREYPDLRAMLGVSAEQSLILYQGEVGPLRRLEPVIQALSEAPRAVLVLRGPGLDYFADHYRQIAQQAGAIDRLHLLEPVPSSDVIAATNGADAGLYTVADLCRSFSCALPNKVFEYLYARLPLLCADFPEVRRLVEESGTGMLFNPDDPHDIARAMRALHDDPQQIAAIRQRILPYVAALQSRNEWDKLADIYDNLAAEVESVS